MAKTIVVELGGTTSSFAFSKVDRSKLYGKRQRLHLDPAGEVCARASLTDDGSLLLRAGMIAQGYFDEDGQWIPHKQLVGVDAEGREVERRDSTLGRAVPLEGPVDATELLDARAQAVYALEPEELDDGLRRRLLDGELFRLPFNYRPDFKDGQAFLVAGVDDEFYAVVAQPTRPEWCAPHELPVIEEDAEDLEDELDFEMF